VFDVDTLECLTVIKTPPHRGAVCGLAVGSDGTVYIGGQDARVQVSPSFPRYISLISSVSSVECRFLCRLYKCLHIMQLMNWATPCGRI